MTFIREATDEIWKMDLDGVYTACTEDSFSSFRITFTFGITKKDLSIFQKIFDDK